MGIPVVIKPSGGLPVSVSTNGYGMPMTVATNGMGLAVTQATGGGGLAVIGMTFGPTIALSASSVLETAAVNTVVGTLSVTAGTTGSPVFALVDSAGGKFNISGTSLRTNALLDYETATFHSITVSVTGVTPTVANATFTILVTDVVEPVIQLTGTSVNENATAGTNIGVLSIANSFTGSPVYTLVDSSSGKVAISGSNLNVLGAIDYETTPTFDITVSVSGITPAAPNKVFTVVVSDVVEGGAPTSPPTTALWGWWDAQHAYVEIYSTPPVTPVANNGLIGTLTDQSGNIHHLIGTGGAASPTLKTGILNSLPAARFAGAQEMHSATGAPAGNNFSIYVVCNQTARVSNFDCLVCNNDGGLSPRYGLINSTAGDGNLRIFNGSNGAISAISATAYHLVAATVDDTGAFPTTMQIDNNTLVSANTTGGGGLGAALVVGNFYTGYWTGDILEVLFYTATHNLASGDGLTVRQYLNGKYNLGLGLGGGAVGTAKNIVSDYGAVGDAE